MKRVFALILLATMTQHVQTQGGIAGYWRAASIVPDGTPDGTVLQFAMELKADGTSISGTVTGIPLAISDGRIEGASVTLNGIDTTTKQQVSLTGNLAGIEIVFTAVGVAPEPVHLIARRGGTMSRGGSENSRAA